LYRLFTSRHLGVGQFIVSCIAIQEEFPQKRALTPALLILLDTTKIAEGQRKLFPL
jgi:hypothetical protein